MGIENVFSVKKYVIDAIQRGSLWLKEFRI